jgi:hypothetical protein
MSSFAFGALTFLRRLDDTELRQVAWELCRCGFGNDVWLFVGGNIPQPLVFEMLGRSPQDETNGDLAYLLTSGPLADTSDGLLAPGETYNLPDDVPIAPIVRGKLERIQTFINSARDIVHVESLCLYLSEGYSPSFEIERLESPSAFTESAFQDWLEHGEFSSRRYVIGSY